MRLRARTDRNQKLIVAALRKAGASVAILVPLGHGIPDLLVGKADTRGVPRCYVLEVKSERGTLTPAEVAWLRDWRGQAAVCYTVDDALRAIGAMR